MRAIRTCRLTLAVGMLGAMAHGSAEGVARAQSPASETVDSLLAQCKQGRSEKCDVLADRAAHMQAGQVLPRDVKGALKIYLDLCALKRRDGCTLAGHLYRQGAEGVAKDPTKALAAYRAACGLGEGGACMTIGSLLADKVASEGVVNASSERTLGEALVYFEKGCELRYEKSCEGSAKMRRALGEAKYKSLLKNAREALAKPVNP